MSRDKSAWFAEEILLDAALINHKLEIGEWAAVEEMLKSEAQLSRDPETGKLRPKKASEYTLRLIAEVLHFMRIKLEQASYNMFQLLAVAEQCLRLIRSCAAYGMKIQTYICKDLNVLDDMLVIFTDYQHSNYDIGDDVMKKFDSCMVALTQTLGNLVVNNPFNQTIIWDKLGVNILNALIGQNEKIASCCAMIVYNILIGQPNVFPDNTLLLNALAYMYVNGNSEFPHLIIEYLIGVENSYIEKLYNKLEPDTKLLILNLAYSLLTSGESQDFNVSVNFIKFIAHEFKMKSDCILKTVDKYVNSIEPQEVVYLLDIIAAASSMEAYLDCLQSDASLFINCAFLLRSIHKLGKQEDNYFSSIHKIYNAVGKTVPVNSDTLNANETDRTESSETQDSVKKCDSTDMLQCNETISECTESESSEQYFECTDQVVYTDKTDTQAFIDNLAMPQLIPELDINAPILDNNYNPQNSAGNDRIGSDYCKIDDGLIKVAFAKNITISDDAMIAKLNGQKILGRKMSMDSKIDLNDEMEPPLITDSPDEKVGIDTRADVINLNRKISLDVNIGRKDSVGAQNVANFIRQQSVERGEGSDGAIREKAASLEANVPKISETLPPMQLETNAAQTEQPKTAEPIQAKKNQNVTTEFDLNEQLQKILGISADKTVRNDPVDAKEPPVQVSHLKAPETTSVVHTPVSSSTTVTQQIADNTNKKPKNQDKIPNVKIDSPESCQRSKVGNFEKTGPKELSTVVESVEQHVAFGFKATVIRTLGNLCYKNQINKRQIRELEVIPVLLDCCNIDARNPLIMQWVILTVRNLCENCPENQSVISSLTLQEPVNNQILQEMGMTLHADPQKNTLKLVPLLKK